MVGAGEAAPAVVALEGLGSRVFPKVAGEFVGSGEPPLTAFPRTPVRLLTCGGRGRTVRGNQKQVDMNEGEGEKCLSER